MQRSGKRYIPADVDVSGWALRFTWSMGVMLHADARHLEDDLFRLEEQAVLRFEKRFGRGLHLWCEANALAQVWVEPFIRPDERWSPWGWDWTDPRAHVFDGDILILPFPVDLGRVLSASEEEFVEFLIDSAKSLIDDAARKRKWGVVPWDGVPPEGGIQSKRQLLSNAAKHRGLDRLWSVLDSAGAAPDSQAAQVLAAAHSILVRAGKKVTTEFTTGMHVALFELDREDLYRRPIRDRGEDPSAPPIPLSADTFLYARCAVITAGRDTFDRVLSEPAAFEAVWDLDAEALLELPSAALDELGTETETPPGLPSYETGSNGDHWPR